MSIYGLFNIGKSALFASQAAIATASHNISNANTQGYSRQEVVLSISSPVRLRNGFLGRGTNVESVRRYYDQFIQSQLLGQHQNYGRSSVLSDTLAYIEQTFNEARDLGLSSSLTGFFRAWDDVSTNPEGLPQRNVLLKKSEALVQTAKQMEVSILGTIESTNDSIDNIVASMNSIASKISKINEKVVMVEVGTSVKANDLRDQREELLRQLSELTDFSSYEDRNGAVNITVGLRNLVYGENTNTLSTKLNDADNKELYLDGLNITSKITKGRLGGLLAVRDDIETNYLKEVRKLIAAITNEVNVLQARGFGLDSTASDFTIADITSDQFPSTGGSILTTSISSFSSFVPGDYEIRFNAAVTQYDVYINGSLLSSANAYTPNSLTVNGITVNFNPADPPVASDKFYISARGKDLFNNLSVYSRDRDNSGADVTSATVFNRTALTYDEYEIRFTGAATYDIYNIDDGVNVVTGAAYVSGSSIRFDGIKVVITNGSGPPSSGDRFLVSPLRNSVGSAGVEITDPKGIAASAASTTLPGDNTQALSIAGLMDTKITALNNTTFSSYYAGLVSDIGNVSMAAEDSLEFDDNLLAEIRNKRESVSGVSLDEEAANLIRFQRAFEAGARIIQVTDDLLETIINMR